MASGVPVVAPAAGGPIDLVAHGETGLLWDPRKPGSIAGAVADLRDDPARRHRLGAAARARVVARSWDGVGDQLVDHYHRVAGAPPAVRVA
jgi:phosphatidylinositol alpha 1,6-mannosyltransferase